MKNKQLNKHSHTGFWIILVAAAVLEAISCLQYFTNRAALRIEAERRAQSELRRAELEINLVTIEVETAIRMMAATAERHINTPDSLAAMQRLMLTTMDNVSNVGIACQPFLFPKKGRWFEIYTNRDTIDGVPTCITREIGNANHDYFQHEWYNNGLTHNDCYWSEPYFDDSGAQSMVVTCSHPIRNRKGEIVAVAGIDLPLHYLQHISEYLQIYKDSYYSIRSGKGTYIVAGEDTVPGRKYQIYDEDIEATGWKISIVIPEDVIFADLNYIGKIVGILMLLGMALLLFIVLYARRDNQRLITSTAQNERMENELHIARAIQMAMLPKAFPPFLDRLDCNVYGIVNPAKEVGGDLYDFYIRQDKLFFCIGDVSGKGVPAALVMAMTRSLFRTLTAQDTSVDGIVCRMNDAMAEQNTLNMFVTLFLGVLDLRTGRLDYCNAGHNAPAIVSDSLPKVKSLPVEANLPIGIMQGYEYHQQTAQLQPNDLLFLYTDGLTEAEDTRHELFGDQRMFDTLTALTDTRPRYVTEAIKQSVEDFTAGAQQSDDLTILAIRYQIPAIVMRNDIQQIPTLSEWIEGLDIPFELNMPVNLALEEVVANVMLYAYPKDSSGKVFVEFAKNLQISVSENSQILIFTVSDSGIPFDPTTRPPADTTLSAEDRAIGGLGIHLVRQLMDEISYRREDNKNILTLIKKL